MDLIVKASKGEININNKTTQKQLTECFTVILRIIASLVTMCTKKSKDKTVKIVKSSNTDKI